MSYNNSPKSLHILLHTVPVYSDDKDSIHRYIPLPQHTPMELKKRFVKSARFSKTDLKEPTEVARPGVGSRLSEPGKKKSADHWRDGILNTGCLQKSEAVGKECNA